MTAGCWDKVRRVWVFRTLGLWPFLMLIVKKPWPKQAKVSSLPRVCCFSLRREKLNKKQSLALFKLFVCFMFKSSYAQKYWPGCPTICMPVFSSRPASLECIWTWTANVYAARLLARQVIDWLFKWEVAGVHIHVLYGLLKGDRRQSSASFSSGWSLTSFTRVCDL